MELCLLGFSALGATPPAFPLPYKTFKNRILLTGRQGMLQNVWSAIRTLATDNRNLMRGLNLYAYV